MRCLQTNRAARCVRFLCSIAIAAALFGPALAADAAVPPYTIEELTRLSTDVVLGELTGVSADWEPWNNGGRVIVTTYTVKVVDRYKGSTPEEIRVSIPGGTVGDVRIAASCAPEMEVGQEMALFLKHDLQGQPRYWVFGLERGAFNVEDGQAEPQAHDLPAIPLSSLKDQVVRTVRTYDNGNR